MNKQAYERAVGAVLSKRADWNEVWSKAKDLGSTAWESIKEHYNKDPELYHRGLIGALAAAGLGGAWKGWRGALAGVGIGTAAAMGAPAAYNYLKERWDQYQTRKNYVEGADEDVSERFPDAPTDTQE